MRILHLTQAYPPIIGGIEQHVRNLSRELAARGHRVSVATLDHPGLAAREDDDGVRVHRLRGTVHRAERVLFTHPGRRYAPPFPDPELARGLLRIIARERPQIVHAHNWLVHSFLPLRRWSRAKLVVGLHDYELVCAKWTLMYRGTPCDGPGPRKCADCAIATYGAARGLPTALANWAMSGVERGAVDLFIPVSRAVADGNALAGGRNGRAARYRVIPEFAPDDVAARRDEADPRLAALPRDDFLLYVGAFGRYKGVDVLLRAYAGLADAPPLVMIGYETSEYPLAGAPIPPGVVVLKQWPHAAVMAAWRRCIVGIIPSVWPDPCPTVAIEAMASGRPVVATRIGGLPDLVSDGETGLLVPPDDPLALRAALARLIADSPLRERLGRAALHRFEQFRAGTVVSRYEDAYRELCAPSPGTARAGGAA